MTSRWALAPSAAIAAALIAAPTTGAEITAQEAREWRPDAAAAREYLASRLGQVSFAIYDMKARHRNRLGRDTAPMASTFKVMLMVAYLRQGHVRDRPLQRWEKDLIKPMIRRSDNAAATQIRDLLGRRPIERLADRAGMHDFRWHAIWGHCRTSARDQARFMRTLQRHVPDRHWGFAKEQLRSIVNGQRWGVGRVEPGGWKLFFKGGWGSGSGAVDHQVALLTRDRRRIGVAVLTEGNPSHAYGKETLEGVFRRLLRGLPR